MEPTVAERLAQRMEPRVGHGAIGHDESTGGSAEIGEELTSRRHDPLVR